jgi:hypothetical protein
MIRKKYCLLTSTRDKWMRDYKFFIDEIIHSQTIPANTEFALRADFRLPRWG